MKDRRVWVIIGCILAAGIAITSYTSSVVKTQQESEIQVLSGDAAEKAVGAAAALQQDEPQKSQDKLEEEKVKEETDTQALKAPVPETGNDAEMQEPQAVPQAAAKDESVTEPGKDENTQIQAEDESQLQVQVEADPDTQSADRETDKNAVLAESSDQESYTDRLKNLDSQIQKMREHETDSNVYSAKTSAETELKMWDGELSVVYNALLEALPKEEALNFANEEKDWLKKRESDAADSSGKTRNGLSYASSMVDQTRERAYELAKRCDELAGK